MAVDDPRRTSVREQLITGYRPVALHIARRFVHRGENPEDLEQVATLGLILAVDRFEPGRGVEFLAFAVPTITGEVLRYFRDRSASIRMPRRLRELQARIYDTAGELGQRHGRAARLSEIAAALGVDIEVVREGLAAHGAAHIFSLDEPAWTDSGTDTDRARFGAALGRVEREFDLVDDRACLDPIVAALPDRERTILMLRFTGGLTQSEIGRCLGISQMHVSRLLARTLATLRRRLAAD
jgi:RNA polymerase sigma-B factor